MNAECNGCGDCCDVIPLQQTADELDALGDHSTAAWARAHLHPLTRRQVLDKGQGWRLLRLVRTVEGEVHIFPRFWTCDLLDPETRLCMGYDERPEMCSGYPWYGGPPQPGAQLSPRCSYRADVGQPVELGATR